MTRIYTQGQPIHWDCPECCGVCGSSYLHCVPPFATDTDVTGQYEVTLTGLPPMFKPSLTKIEAFSLRVWANGSLYNGESLTFNGHIRKLLERSAEDASCAIVDNSSTSDEHIFNENFPLITEITRTCHTWYGEPRCLCTGTWNYLLGLKNFPSSAVRLGVLFGTRRSTTEKTHSAYVSIAWSFDELVQYTYPISRLSNGYLVTEDISFNLDHKIFSIGTCAEDGELGGRVYGKGYCYSEWLEGLTFRIPYQYTVSGRLYADTVGSSYDSSPRAENLQMFLGLLAGRGYNVVRREGSTEYYDVSYTQQSTATCTVKFTPDAS